MLDKAVMTDSDDSEKAISRNGIQVIARAAAPAHKEAFKAQTGRAIERGIFGAPSFVAQGELFWGDDRLEAALDWAASHGHDG